MTADQAAATASIRTLGTGALQAAPGNHTHPAQTTITGNAGTATKLETARNINGVAFDGTSDVTINAVDSTARIAVSEKGVANGVATLDANGLVQASQLPSYVDDVLEYASFAGFPATGETGKIYVALDTNKTYRWSGSAYIYITSGAVDSVAGKTGVVTLVKADVGLGNVNNTSDADKPVSTAQQSALNLKADLASPTLTGTPTAPTATTGTNTTQLATTAFVQAVNTAGTSIAATAAKLTTPRNISLTGVVTGNVNFDGSANVSISTSIDEATTSTQGIVLLSNATDSTAMNIAATSAAVKSAYDLAAKALDDMIEPFLLMGV